MQARVHRAYSIFFFVSTRVVCVAWGGGDVGWNRQKGGRRGREGRTYDDETEDQGIVRNVCDAVGAEAEHDDGEEELHGV